MKNVGITPIHQRFKEFELLLLRHSYCSIQELLGDKGLTLHYISATATDEKIEFTVDELINKEI